jgi:hypothetical protein
VAAGAFVTKDFAAFGVANEDEAPVAACFEIAQMNPPAVAERERDEGKETESDHRAALLQCVTGRQHGERNEQSRGHRGEQCDGVHARVIESGHVGALAVAIDQENGYDEQDQGYDQRIEDRIARVADAPKPTHKVEDERECVGIEQEEADGHFTTGRHEGRG